MKTGFSNDQYDFAYPEGIESHWWHLARNGILAKTICKTCGPNARILEIGCGHGIVVKFLRSCGIDCSGVKLADVTPINAITNHIHVKTNAVEMPRAERLRYDTILLLDVIEHIPDPRVFLKELASAFPNLRHIIVTVPARQELWSNYDLISDNPQPAE